MNQAIVKGSLSDIARQNNTSIAESFMSADVIIIVDTSGSMDTRDARGNKSRYDVALEELARLQRELPGKIAVIAFSSTVQFIPGGIPPFLGGGTDLAGALRFVRVADGLVRFIVVSDGQPDNEKSALDVARGFRSRIDVVYVGPEDSLWGGREFLERLAKASGGTFSAQKVDELASTVSQLLLN